MRDLIVTVVIALGSALLPLAACQPTLIVNNHPDAGGDGGLDGGGGFGPIAHATDAGVCNFGCTTGQFCAVTGDCVTCRSDADCASSLAGTHCDTRPGALANFGLCVECVVPSQCGSGTACDPSSDNCVPAGSDANCAASAEVYDPESGACVACLTSADCNGQLCDPVALSCVDCLQPSDCPAGSPGCYQGVCGQCNVSSDCPGSEVCTNGLCGCATDQACPAATPNCVLDGGPGVCGCTANASCTGANEVCDSSQGLAGACVLSCSAPGGVCLANTDTGEGVCDTTSGLCVQCLTNAQCTDVLSPFCVSGNCAECNADADCAALDAGTPYCSQALGGLCVECTAPSQCPTDNEGCDSSGGNCGSCTLSADCPSPLGCGESSGLCAPFCGTQAASGAPDCAACASSTDCDGGSCNADAGLCG